MGNKEAILERFFSNSDRPIYALKEMPPAIQSYLYMGVSRFPGMRERFIKMLEERNLLEKAAEAARQGNAMEEALRPFLEFAAEKNAQIYFEFRHKSAAEGSSIFFVSEQNPIYATETQQDFFVPMTTMELSTRYSRKFGLDKVYWEPKIMQGSLGKQAKQAMTRNLELYEKGFEILAENLKGKKQEEELPEKASLAEKPGNGKQEELPEKVSILDSLRFLIPLACHTTLILGGNTRAVIEHLQKLLGYEDSFVQEYAKACIAEASKSMPEYFSDLKADQGIAEREKRVASKAEELFGKKFSPAKEKVRLFFEKPTEETALTQILYPHCSLDFGKILERVSGLGKREKQEIFKAATETRQNRANPVRGFETRPLVFEIESSWAMWKDFKRNRMNLRFQQPIRGKAGFEVPELIQGSEMEKDYANAMQETADLIEKVFQEHGSLSRTVAAQGSNKRYLLCMGARQLTVLGELRTCGEGDKGYRRIASRMIELAKEERPWLFAHVKDNFKK